MIKIIKQAFLAVAIIVWLPAVAVAQNPIAIKGARIVTGEGPVIEKGTVIIQGDRIIAVGGDVEAGSGAQVIDGTGLTVYPGLIDAFCLAGVAAPPTPTAQPQAAQQPRGQQRRGQQQSGPPPAPPTPLVWRRATEGFNPKSAALLAMRNNGYTAALLGTRGVLTPGENALVNLIPGGVAAMLFREKVALNVNTLSRGGGAYPGTLMGAYAFLRQAFYDGIDQRNQKPGNPEPRLEALGAAAAGQIPVFYAAQSENDIKRALRFGKEFSVRLVILGGRESEKVIPLLLGRKITVVLTDDWSPAIALSKAGIPFALASNIIEMTVSEANDQRDKMQALVEKGLTPDAILAALTRTPADLLGIAPELGSIKAGKLANLAIVEGDLFKKESKVRFVIVNGVRVDSAPVTAEGPKRPRVSEDGTNYTNVAEDDADDHGDGGAK